MGTQRRPDELDAALDEEKKELSELQSNLAENKEASAELTKSLGNLEAAMEEPDVKKD